MKLQHSKTQAVQFFQVVTKTKGVVNYRRFGPNQWELQVGKGWEPASGPGVLEAAYREYLARVSADSVPSKKITHVIDPLPTERRLRDSLSLEQQKLVADWLDEEVRLFSQAEPNSYVQVHERMSYLAARLRALANG